MKKYIKGDYIVLLSTCNGDPNVWLNSIPVNYVYQLDKDFDWHHLSLVLDNNKTANNGWSISNLKENKLSYGKMTVRAATPYEIEDYIRAGGPVKANQIRAYEIY